MSEHTPVVKMSPVLSTLLSLLCIGFMIFVWIFEAEIAGDTIHTYPNPFFMRWFCQLFAIFLLVPWYIYMRFFSGKYELQQQAKANRKLMGSKDCEMDESEHSYLGVYSLRHMVKSAIYISGFQLFGGWLWYLALPRTSISGNIAVDQSQVFLIYALSVVLLGESLTFAKVTTVVISFSGVLCVSYSDSMNETPHDANDHGIERHPSLLGYVLCFAAALMYALFETTYKKCMHNDNDHQPISSAVVFTGILAVVTVIMWAPMIYILHVTGIEPFHFPSPEHLNVLMILAVIDSLFVLAMLTACVLCTPLFVSVGCLLVIPCSCLWDMYAHKRMLPPLGLVGVAVIGLGVLGFSIADSREHTDHEEHGEDVEANAQPALRKSTTTLLPVKKPSTPALRFRPSPPSQTVSKRSVNGISAGMGGITHSITCPAISVGGSTKVHSDYVSMRDE
eukprot:GDKI01031372.1.p1 GENE.GDKI01031372.1~~GDKI01031372.1.p1  ORF type:complete len:449 (-),score=119.39 GDKI01031372.1:25-1371(-)